MAVLGVMLAICAALVGSQRTEFIATVVGQANVNAEYQASSTKYRIMISALRQMYGQTPTLEEVDAYAKGLEAVPAKYHALNDQARSIQHAIVHVRREHGRARPRPHLGGDCHHHERRPERDDERNDEPDTAQHETSYSGMRAWRGTLYAPCSRSYC